MIGVLALVLFGYFTGGIPFGVILARWKGVDIREHGSGNIGATNVTRILGAKLGAIVLLLDAAKGALPTWYALHHTADPWLVVATAAATIIGHCFSPFLEFTGGKGVATATGVFLVLAPRELAIGIGVFAAVLAWKRVPALGSLAAIATIAGLMIYRGDTWMTALAVGTLILLVYTHRSNLAKLGK